MTFTASKVSSSLDLSLLIHKMGDATCPSQGRDRGVCGMGSARGFCTREGSQAWPPRGRAQPSPNCPGPACPVDTGRLGEEEVTAEGSVAVILVTVFSAHLVYPRTFPAITDLSQMRKRRPPGQARPVADPRRRSLEHGPCAVRTHAQSETHQRGPVQVRARAKFTTACVTRTAAVPALYPACSSWRHRQEREPVRETESKATA